MCNIPHTNYQIQDEEWECPNCGDVDNFSIVEREEGVGDCLKLHKNDYCYCHKCNKGWAGQKLVKLISKKKNLIPCPHCKGAGVIENK